MADTRAGPRLTVIGEAAIDLVPAASPASYQARPGGSPFNVAIGLARLPYVSSPSCACGGMVSGHPTRENRPSGRLFFGS
jgi:fructokinase